MLKHQLGVWTSCGKQAQVLTQCVQAGFGLGPQAKLLSLLFFAVKDLDTEKYFHLVSILLPELLSFVAGCGGSVWRGVCSGWARCCQLLAAHGGSGLPAPRGQDCRQPEKHREQRQPARLCACSHLSLHLRLSLWAPIFYCV